MLFSAAVPVQDRNHRWSYARSEPTCNHRQDEREAVEQSVWLASGGREGVDNFNGTSRNRASTGVDSSTYCRTVMAAVGCALAGNESPALRRRFSEVFGR